MRRQCDVHHCHTGVKYHLLIRETVKRDSDRWISSVCAYHKNSYLLRHFVEEIYTSRKKAELELLKLSI